MSTPQIENLVYLSALGAILVALYVVRDRARWGQHLRHLATWALIILGAVAVAGLWDDIRRTTTAHQAQMTHAGAVAIPRAPDGHYYAILDVNGADIRFVVDTGASGIVLSPADARRAGIDTTDLAYFGQAQTANGIVRTAPVTLERVVLGPVEDRRVPALVNSADMAWSLLGMQYLERFARVEIGDGRMMLYR
jgi:aspartyl protease family protein